MSEPKPLPGGEPKGVFVDVGDGLRLRLWAHTGAASNGPNKDPVVLFVHGYLDTGRSFDEVVRELDQIGCPVRALCLDFRGHGESERAGPGASHHLLDHLKDLAALTAQLELKGLPEVGLEAGRPAAIVAHSMGGNVALLLAGALPERVQRLLLIDAMGPPPEDLEEQPERLGRLLNKLGPARPFSVFPTREAAIARVVENNGGLSRVGAERMAHHALVEVEGGFGFAFDPRLKGPVPMRYPEAFWLGLCARVSATVIVMRAEGGYLPEGELLQGRLGALGSADAPAELVEIGDVGHHLHVEAPDVIASTLSRLLRSR